jgi:NAD(P)-dependent dehydrogenase (short-subunit alcohol dehydrogenase family)
MANESVDRNSLGGGVAVVTGGAGSGAGLGQGLVRRFAAEGMQIAILDVDGAAAEALAIELRSSGTDAIACIADVLDHESLRAAASHVRGAFGACNILCAHVGGGGQGPFDALQPELWRRTFDVMVIGTVATVQAFLPLMRETAGLRRIVLTSSAAALAPGVYQGPYRSAKAAVTSIGETLDFELGSEGVGTTIVFPSGMLPPALVDLRNGDGAETAEALSLTPEAQNVMNAVVAEMASDPTDVTTGAAAAAPVIDAIIAGRRYVVTHGMSVDRNYRSRHELIEEALADLESRGYNPYAGD